jgi:transcription initiation factor TFIID subunit 2
MDLYTVGTKLDSGIYRSRQEFVADVRLIIANCLLYNRSDSPIHAAAIAFESYFNECKFGSGWLIVVWAKTETTLSAARTELEQPEPRARPEPRVEARPEPVEPRIEPRPTIRLKAMAPPPVPVKKRTAAEDLGEVDAIEKRPKIVLKSEVDFKTRRSKALLATLKQDPNAYFVSRVRPC